MVGKLIRSMVKSAKGNSLIEAVVLISIMGILAGFAIPSLSKNDLVYKAQQNINEINAKTLTTVCQIIELESGEFPAWPSTFTVLTTEEANYLIDSDIKFIGEGFFKYDFKTGTVTVSSRHIKPEA